jgi:hypothetical protein
MLGTLLPCVGRNLAISCWPSLPALQSLGGGETAASSSGGYCSVKDEHACNAVSKHHCQYLSRGFGRSPTYGHLFLRSSYFPAQK